MKTTLQECLAEMQSLTGKQIDAANAHIQADHQLLNLLERFKTLLSDENAALLDDVLQEYENVEKWYANEHPTY